MNRLPIVYIRGYAGPTAGINAQVDDPFYGFNVGATHTRVGLGGKPKFYQFEGPMLRLMIDHDYKLLVHGDQQSYLQRQGDGSVERDSIWVYRFYDQAATTFMEPPHRGILPRIFTELQSRVTAKGFNIEQAAEGLHDLITLLQLKMAGDDKRVIIVAHSMGGLIARCMMQKIAVARNTRAKDLVAKLFTYGTPHGGVVFRADVLNWFEEVIGPAGSTIFSPPNMYGYLTPGARYGEQPQEGEDWDPQTVPEDVFDPDDIFCLIGTDYKDYGAPKAVVGPKSDGLVMIEHAYVRKAHRAFVFKSHSGTYGEVNSEEGYQNLRRFLFGQWKVEVDFAGLPNYPIPGDDESTIWEAEIGLSTRGLPVVLSEQRADQYNPIQLNAELARRQDSPDHPVPLMRTFLLDPTASTGTTRTLEEEAAAKHHHRARYTLTLRVGKLIQRDDSFDFSEHLERVFDWSDTAIFDVGPDEGGTGVAAWAAWNSDVQGAIDEFDPIAAKRCDIGRKSAGQWQFDLALPKSARRLRVLGVNAVLRITITDRTVPAQPDGTDDHDKQTR